MKLNELNLENIGSWPPRVKGVVVCAFFILVVLMGYWFDGREQLTMLSVAQKNELKLMQELAIKQHQATNFDKYQAQLIKVNKIFTDLLRRLPTKSEVPGLLEDISKTGVANGLEFKLFKPLPEIQASFYRELPLKISIIGNYHQLAQFISKIAALDRIVTLHDFSIKHVKSESKLIKSKKNEDVIELTEPLELDLIAKTYRYTGENELANNNKKRVRAK